MRYSSKLKLQPKRILIYLPSFNSHSSISLSLSSNLSSNLSRYYYQRTKQSKSYRINSMQTLGLKMMILIVNR